ncbi:MAG: DUF1080 domain-containing protein, partial [Longimicrobiales bacterium]
MKRTLRGALIGVILAGSPIGGHAAGALQVEQASVVGRWDLTVTGPSGTHPSWLEVRRSGDRMLV